MTKKCVIFDLDGCISDDRWRHPLLPGVGEKQDYTLYHSKCAEDKPMNKRVFKHNLLKAERGGFEVVIVTARPVEFEPQTRDWLAAYFGEETRFIKLFMRPAQNKQSSPAVKAQAASTLKASGYEIVCAYDDRADVLAAYHQRANVPAARLVQLDRDGCRGFRPSIEVQGRWPRQVRASDFHSARGETPHVKHVDESPFAPTREAHDTLLEAATTFEERNAVYRDNYKAVGPIMKALFPEGAPPEVLHSDHFHLLELIVVKLTRFARTGSTHKDSMRDIQVYAAMIETILENGK